MSHLDPRSPTSRKELRSFAFLVGGAFLVLAAIVFRGRGITPLSITFASIAGVLGVLGSASPALLRPVHAAWMRFAVLLSKVTTPIFMGVIYFVVLTPIGLLMRAFGRNPLRGPAGASRWTDRASGARASDLARQF